MRIVSIRFVAIAILTPALVWAQQPSDSSTTLAFENGSIANNVYSNDCLGFSLAIPAAWRLNTQFLGADGKARHAGEQLVLLLLDQHKEGSFGNRIVLTARDASGSAPGPEEFVSKSLHAQLDADREHRQWVKDNYSVDYGGKIFFRADYKQAIGNGGTLYGAFVYTKFRGFYIGETNMAGSPEELDQGASSLQQISFRGDEPNPKCVMSNDNSPNAGGVIGGAPSSKPGTPQPDSGQPIPVRVPEGVATGLLIKKVAPEYPNVARQARVQGQVVMKAVIDKNGDIADLTLVSGHPMLAPAAFAAVKQWKYKPYTRNGEPVEVETEITVSFSLSVIR
jgi:TonB family protein